MNKERAFVIKLVGKDIYQLLIKYLLRALSSQFDMKHNLRKWPSVCCSPILAVSKHFHPVVVYLAMHAILTMQQFHKLFTVCKTKWKKFRVYNCLCGKQFGVNTNWLYWNYRNGPNGVAYTATGAEIHVHELNILSDKGCIACNACVRQCSRCSINILSTMPCCIDCEKDSEVIQNVKVVDDWVKRNKKPF